MAPSELHPPATHYAERVGAVGNIAALEASKVHVLAATRADSQTSGFPVVAIESPHEALRGKNRRTLPSRLPVAMRGRSGLTIVSDLPLVRQSQSSYSRIGAAMERAQVRACGRRRTWDKPPRRGHRSGRRSRSTSAVLIALPQRAARPRPGVVGPLRGSSPLDSQSA
jgi:hypothetical protein